VERNTKFQEQELYISDLNNSIKQYGEHIQGMSDYRGIYPASFIRETEDKSCLSLKLSADLHVIWVSRLLTTYMCSNGLMT